MAPLLLLVAVLALATPAAAQDQPAASGGTAPAPAQNAADLPVSLDRIREGLLKSPDQPLLRSLDRKPDFTIEVAEQARIDAILSKLDFRGGPAPAGGLYAYEQQRRLFNPTSRPLQQPYAAFSGGELITIAIENLLGRYLGGRLWEALTSAERARAEAQAREEVETAVSEYLRGTAGPGRDPALYDASRTLTSRQQRSVLAQLLLTSTQFQCSVSRPAQGH